MTSNQVWKGHFESPGSWVFFCKCGIPEVGSGDGCEVSFGSWGIDSCWGKASNLWIRGVYIYTHYIHHIHIHIYIYLIDIISWGMPNPWFTVGKIVITVFLTIHDLHLLSLSTFTAFLEDHPFRKWLGSPLFKNHRFRPFGRGPTSPGIGDNNDHHSCQLVTIRGMILQVWAVSGIFRDPQGHGTPITPYYSHFGIPKDMGMVWVPLTIRVS